MEDGEVESREEFEELWLSEYPDLQKWYKLSTTVYKGIYSVFMNNKLVLQINPVQLGQYPYDKSELAERVLTAAKEAIASIKSGSYSQRHRITQTASAGGNLLHHSAEPENDVFVCLNPHRE